jgi:hypothetical protein
MEIGLIIGRTLPDFQLLAIRMEILISAMILFPEDFGDG